MTRTLVAGSYPPVPGAAAAASLGAVRREIATGAEVQVMSPRPSAAHHVGTLHGTRAGLAVFSRGRAMRADAVVVCVEPGIPFAIGSSRLRVRVETAMLLVALRRFDRVVVLAPLGLGAGADRARALWARADEIAVPDDETRAQVRSVAGVRAENVVVVADEPRAGEVYASPLADRGPAAGDGVSPCGPRVPLGDALRLLPERGAHAAERVGAQWAYALLGDRAGVVGRPLRSLTAPLRAAVVRVSQRSGSAP